MVYYIAKRIFYLCYPMGQNEVGAYTAFPGLGKSMYLNTLRRFGVFRGKKCPNIVQPTRGRGFSRFPALKTTFFSALQIAGSKTIMPSGSVEIKTLLEWSGLNPTHSIGFKYYINNRNRRTKIKWQI